MEFKEEQRMIQDVSRKFAIKEIVPIAGFEKEDVFPTKEMLKRIAHMGLLGIMVPEEQGGAGSDMISHILALEEISSADVGLAISYSGLCTLANAILAHGSEKVTEACIPGLISGDRIGAFGFMEAAAGSVSEEMQSTAKQDQRGWTIHGEKVFIINGAIADFYMIFSRTGPADGHAFGMYHIEGGQNGVSVNPINKTLGIKSASLADVSLDNVRSGYQISGPDKTMEMLSDYFDELKIGAAAISNGVAMAAMEGAIAYSKIRVQFGNPIYKFPAIANRIADMDIMIRASKNLTYSTGLLRDKKRRFKKEAAQAKVFASEVAYKVCHSGLQVYGGHGFIKEHPIEKYYRDQRILQIYAETNEVNRNIISPHGPGEMMGKTGTIDMHIHLGSLFYLDCPAMVQLKETNRVLYEKVKKDMTDDPRELERFLIEQGIDCAVMIPELHPLNNFNVTTEMVVQYCKGSRILIPFANINPNTEGEPVRKLRHYVRELGCKGIKLLPSYHHFPVNDRRLYPLYEAAQEMRLPVMFHIGSSTFPHTKLKYCDPLLLDETCADFPDLTVIACHGGRGFWYEQVFFLLTLHRNLHIDVAGLPPRKLLDYFPELEKRADRFLFGSDWPTIPSTIRENIDSIRGLPLSEESQAKVLRDNARRILNL